MGCPQDKSPLCAGLRRGRERILARVQVGLVFRSQFRGVAPDPELEHSLTGQPQALGFREYVDAGPGDWLVWPGRGPYGPTRYACTEHRVGRRDFVRRRYGVIGWHPHARVLGDGWHPHARVLGDFPPGGGGVTLHGRRRRDARPLLANHGRVEPSLGFRG
jgi:hypothetical protein